MFYLGEKGDDRGADRVFGCLYADHLRTFTMHEIVFKK